MSNSGAKTVSEIRVSLQEKRSYADDAFRQFRENALAAAVLSSPKNLNELLERIGFSQHSVTLGVLPHGLPHHLIKNREAALPA